MMHIVVLGLNYRTAPVEIREKFTFLEEQVPQAIAELKETKSVLECVIVATCNRTELYAVVDKVERCGHYMRQFMERWFGVSREQFGSHLYMKEGTEAVQHLFRVTSGLDSMIIGETQILGQVKNAFLQAQSLQATGTLFNELFKQSVTLAKRVHSETSIGENPVSVSYAAVELGKRIFGNYAGRTVMIIGAGKMSELTVKHLYASGANQVYVVNRTHQRAVELAEKFQGKPIEMEQMTDKLVEVDIVISSTGASGYVLTYEMLQPIIQKRKAKPLFMMDIAVPRDLDPRLSELPDVFLYDIDDLESIVESNLQERRNEAKKIESKVQEESVHFEQWKKTLGVSPIIQALHTKANMVHQDTMDSLMKKLPDLDEREIRVIHKLTKSIVNQMLRDPIVRLKEMSSERHADEALNYFTQIFALEELLTLQELEETSREKASQAAELAGRERKSEDDKEPTVIGLSGREALAGT
jgi:glutamyl-tRNA reductase